LDLRAFKIVTGEEIIAELLGDKADHYEISRPRQLGLIQAQAPDGSPSLIPHLVPWIVCNPDGNFQLMKSKVILYVPNIPKGLGNMYIQDVTGIQSASGIDPKKIVTR
jgi:hypothetical protein